MKHLNSLLKASATVFSRFSSSSYAVALGCLVLWTTVYQSIHTVQYQFVADWADIKIGQYDTDAHNYTVTAPTQTLTSSIRASSALPSFSQNTTSGTELRADDPLQAFAQGNNPVFLVKLSTFGLGSQLMALFTKMVYFEEDFNRSVVATESQYGYRRNETVGVLTGYFTPQFPVIDHASQYPILDPWLKDTYNLTTVGEFHPPLLSSYPKRPQDRVWLTSFLYHRKVIKKHYNTASEAFYNKMSQRMCPNLQFNEATRLEIQKKKQELGFPDLVFTNETSVAFHVRRTDKISWRESKQYNGSVYVDKLLSVAPENVTFHHCYIATDDEVAIHEIQRALADAQVSCGIFAMRRGEQNPQKRTSPEQTLALMTELSMLIDATYFVGTFSSNLGAVVAVLRSCNASNPEHFAQSFGVDRKSWFFY